ncbi:DsbA family protein [Pseudoduganella sp. R-43]|uniref:DsbA family protein n=1 Tax=Pseudoduganella sp. R-43 TaxID=3404063 RepID=UPI003CF852E8
MQSARLKYIFDPLCGWCYASALALEALSEAYPDLLELMPSGLFSDAGARVMTPEWAHHAWSNDQRIEAMTGQPFSAAYQRNILQGPGTRFDSGAMNRALTAIHALDPLLEPLVLRRLQWARYVDGLDTSNAMVVAAECARQVAGLDAIELAGRLEHDAELALQATARINATRDLMRRAGVNGVPVLLLQGGEGEYIVSGAALYGDGAELVSGIARLLAAPSPARAR